MALAIVLGRPLQLYNIHAYYYRSVLGGMRGHFNFLSWHVCILYIAYHEYSMIDPSGTMISGTCCCELATFALLCESVTGLGACGRTVLRLSLLVAFSLFSALTRPCGSFTICFELVGFMGFETWFFMGMWGHAGWSSVSRPIFGCISVCVYMYIFLDYAANLCDAGCGCMCFLLWFLCWFCFFILFQSWFK